MRAIWKNWGQKTKVKSCKGKILLLQDITFAISLDFPSILFSSISLEFPHFISNSLDFPQFSYFPLIPLKFSWFPSISLDFSISLNFPGFPLISINVSQIFIQLVSIPLDFSQFPLNSFNFLWFFYGSYRLDLWLKKILRITYSSIKKFQLDWFISLEVIERKQNAVTHWGKHWLHPAYWHHPY